MTSDKLQADIPNFEQLVANEKLQYMLSFAKSSTIATVLAPLLCIPLYLQTLVYLCRYSRSCQLFNLSNHQHNRTFCRHGGLLRQLEIVQFFCSSFEGS
jgi:hypothetical protein